MSRQKKWRHETEDRKMGYADDNGSLVFVELCHTFMYGDLTDRGIPAGKKFCAAA